LSVFLSIAPPNSYDIRYLDIEKRFRKPIAIENKGIMGGGSVNHAISACVGGVCMRELTVKFG
jgi:hypothetical protein